MSKFIPIEPGTQFGDRTVIRYVGRKWKESIYEAQCRCGKIQIITRGNLLRKTRCRSCTSKNIQRPKEIIPAGTKIGDRVVLRYLGHRKDGTSFYEVQCKCGKIQTSNRRNLRNSTKCLACHNKDMAEENARLSLIPNGTKIGKWTVINKIKGDYHTLYECICECGNKKNIKVSELIRERADYCSQCDPLISAGTKYGYTTVLGYKDAQQKIYEIEQKCGHKLTLKEDELKALRKCNICEEYNLHILTQTGLSPVNESLDERQLWGLKGFNKVEQFRFAEKQAVLKITLQSGYRVECSTSHFIWNGESWIKASNLITEDLLPIQYEQNIWPRGLDTDAIKDYKPSHHSRSRVWNVEENLVLNEDFFYLLGLIHGDGFLAQQNYVIVASCDKPIQDFLLSYGFTAERGGTHYRFNSREFVNFIWYLGFKSGAHNKVFPERLWQCNKAQMRAFLQGLFDADGTSNSNASKRGNIKLVSVCKQLIEEIQIILLNFGIVSSIYKEFKLPYPNGLVKVSSTNYNLEIAGYFSYRFFEEIGFRLERKQANRKYIVERCTQESGNIYPVNTSKLENYKLGKKFVTNPNRISRRLLVRLNDKKPHPYLQSLLEEKLYYSPIKSIEVLAEKQLVELKTSNSNSYFANGFILRTMQKENMQFTQLKIFDYVKPKTQEHIELSY